MEGTLTWPNKLVRNHDSLFLFSNDWFAKPIFAFALLITELMVSVV